VYVSIFNSANGIPVPQSTHQHGPIVMDTVDYKIAIPANHPSGLFWFHPHVHGIALNQVVQGLSGMITIGSVGDNLRGDAVNSPWPETNARHLMFKEIQVLAGGTINFDSGPQPVAAGEVLNQEDTSCYAVFRDQRSASGLVPGPGQQRKRRQQHHRRKLVHDRQRSAIPLHSGCRGVRRDLASRDWRRQLQLEPATR
jgi:hypothetical protein